MSATAMVDMMLGKATLLVGVEDGPDGALKCYVGHRGDGVFCLVTDPGEQEKIRRAWAGTRGHVVITTPPAGALYKDSP